MARCQGGTLIFGFQCGGELAVPLTAPEVFQGMIGGGLKLMIVRAFDILARRYLAMVQNQWYHFWMGAPPIFESILVGIGRFTEKIRGLWPMATCGGLPGEIADLASRRVKGMSVSGFALEDQPGMA